MVNKNIIEFSGVSKQYRESNGETVNALQSSDLSVYAGEFFTLLGPSGCGKTTALRLMAGFIQPSDGEIKIEGKTMNNVPPYHRPVNMVFQDYALFPHLSVFENVAFGLKIKRMRKDPLARRLPVIMMSGNPRAVELFHKLQVKADGFVRKPFTRKAMFESIEALLDDELIPRRLDARGTTHVGALLRRIGRQLVRH